MSLLWPAEGPQPSDQGGSREAKPEEAGGRGRGSLGGGVMEETSSGG